jgi:hypothetical protein
MVMFLPLVLAAMVLLTVTPLPAVIATLPPLVTGAFTITDALLVVAPAAKPPAAMLPFGSIVSGDGCVVGCVV